jgi:hypothetical protein
VEQENRFKYVVRILKESGEALGEIEIYSSINLDGKIIKLVQVKDTIEADCLSVQLKVEEK